MMMTASRQGNASVRSSKWMCAIWLTIRNPTRMSAGAVANAGITVKTGASRMQTRNSAAVTYDARPVRPPSETPVADSTYVVVVVAPMSAPAVVATASASRAYLRRGRWPSLSSMFAVDATPVRVPSVLKRSSKSSVNITRRKLPEMRSFHPVSWEPFSDHLFASRHSPKREPNSRNAFPMVPGWSEGYSE